MARHHSQVLEYPIRDLQGVNRLDAGERMLDNQFYSVQNFYHAAKGVLQKRYGTTQDLSAAQLFGANRVSGIWRHHNQNREKFTLYFCEPNTTPLPAPTVDLGLTDVPGGGDLYDGGTSVPLSVCYTFIGMGQESIYNSASRVGYVAGTDLSPVSAQSQPGHQTIALAANTNTLRVTAPGSFPNGVRACNIFVARGGTSTTQLVYVGSIATPGGTLDVKKWVAPYAAGADSLSATLAATSGGSLKPGTYWVGMAWLVDSEILEGQTDPAKNGPSLTFSQAISLASNESAIQATLQAGVSANGAKSAYVFIGTQDPKLHPMTCVGIVGRGETITIGSVPINSNAQTVQFLGDISVVARFEHRAIYYPNSNRMGFVVKKDSNGVLSELFPSRSLWVLAEANVGDDPVYGQSSAGLRRYYLGWPRTANDTVSATPDNGSIAGIAYPRDWGRVVYDPTFAYLNGLTYFVNGVDIPWQTDGYAMGQIGRVSATTLPPYPRFLFPFKNSLIAAGAEAKNQVFSSNANAPGNWAVGGTGAAKIFVTIGDLFGDEVTALGIFTLATDGANTPRSFIIAFKKHGVWMTDSITAGDPMQQLSGRVGCVSPRSIVSTNRGVVFLGSDGDWYIIRNAAQEPSKIGTSVQAIFSHLPASDTLAGMVTAVFHDYQLKVSFPSSASSASNDAQMWADFKEGGPITWSGPHVGVNVGAQIVFVGESDDMSRWGIRSDGLATLKLDDVSVMADLGSPIVSMIQSKTFRFRDETHMKRVLGIIFDAFWDSSFSHSVLVEGFADQYYSQVNKTLSTGGATWDVSNWDQSNFGDAFFQNITALFPNNLVGRTFSFKLTHSSHAQFIVAAANILFKPERRRVL